MEIKITESQYKKLFEGVYVNDLDTKRGKAKLAYSQGVNYQKGNKNSFDTIKTDKMDVNNKDTYEVPLKGGIMSYNITSIKGTEVMHYFKRKWDSQKTMLKIGNEEYELNMDDQEFVRFINQFQKKVNYVVQYCYDNFKRNNPNIEFSGISIYPVPSSSKFNENMAKVMQQRTIIDLPIQVINQNLLKKDLTNLQRDNEFINKNKEYYNNDFSTSSKGTVMQHVDTEINKMNSRKKALELLWEVNDNIKNIIHDYYYITSRQKIGADVSKTLLDMCEWYGTYFVNIQEIKEKLKYFDTTTQQEIQMQLGQAINPIKYTKGPSVQERSRIIWDMVKPYFRQNNLFVRPLMIQYWNEKPFQIKTLPNGVRMGLKGMYNRNEDEELVKQELDKIKGTIFLIFDDNISGGSTLSDVCNECKKLGINYIIPITFGQMQTKWGFGRMPTSLPINNKGEKGQFNY